MHLLAIDPGPTESAFVRMGEDNHIYEFGKVSNSQMRDVINLFSSDPTGELAIEMIASYGMAVGASVFETCVHIGRFVEIWTPREATRITRNEIKNHICHSSKAKDANIRAALIDRWGGPQAIKKGGPLYKVSSDVWAALALACTYLDRVNRVKP